MNIAVFRTGLMLFQGLLISIAGCSNNYRAPVADVAGGTGYVNSGRTHRVNSGETLYAIAWIYDLDYTRLARLNNIDPPYTIYAGQTLSVDPRAVAAVATPASAAVSSNPQPQVSSVPTRTAPRTSTVVTSPVTPAPVSRAGPLVWGWPAGGSVIGRFARGDAENKGVDISGRSGDSVNAAADGEVVYAGRGLLRYGDMIILKHNDRFLSAYAHNRQLLVSEGERVRRGQKIAELGSTGIGREMLHFEIRMDGNPVDPLIYLPSR